MSEISPKMFLAWVGTHDANDDFEVIAYWFHTETRLLAPGKSCACGHDCEAERREAYKKWLPEAKKRMASYARQLVRECDDKGSQENISEARAQGRREAFEEALRLWPGCQSEGLCRESWIGDPRMDDCSSCINRQRLESKAKEEK